MNEYHYKILTDNSNHTLSIIDHNIKSQEKLSQGVLLNFYQNTEVQIQLKIQRIDAEDRSLFIIHTENENLAFEFASKISLLFSEQQNFAYHYYPKLVQIRKSNESGEKITNQLLFTSSVAIVKSHKLDEYKSKFLSIPLVPVEVSILFNNGIKNYQNGESMSSFVLLFISLEKLLRSRSTIQINSEDTHLIDLMKDMNENYSIGLSTGKFDVNGIYYNIRNDIVHGKGEYTSDKIKDEIPNFIKDIISIFKKMEEKL